jgi:hypothetical protein
MQLKLEGLKMKASLDEWLQGFDRLNALSF